VFKRLLAILWGSGKSDGLGAARFEHMSIVSAPLNANTRRAGSARWNLRR